MTPERPSIVAFRSWKAEQLAEIERRRTELEEQLLKLAPSSLAVYFREEVSIIPDLLEHGRAVRSYHDRGCGGGIHSEVIDYGFSSLAALRRTLVRLKVAWGTIVEIELDNSESHRGKLTVRYTLPEESPAQ